MHARLKLRPSSIWAISSAVLLSAVQHVKSTGAQSRSGVALTSKVHGLLLELQPDPLWHVPPPMAGPLPYQGEWTNAPPWKEWNGKTANDEENSEPSEPEVYRPWASRFKHLPGDPYTNKQENREGYRRFLEMHPHHPNTPGSADRNAESATMLVCALAAFGTVIGALFSLERFSGAAHPERMHLMLGVSFSLPWLLAMVYLVHVAMEHFAHPARGPTGQHWECDAATWSHGCLDYQAPMGRMIAGGPRASMMASRSRFLKSPDGSEETNIEKLLKTLGKPSYANSFLALEVVATALGLALSIHVEYLCEPEVWWAVTFIAVATIMVLIVAPVTIFLISFFNSYFYPVEESIKRVDSIGSGRIEVASGMRSSDVSPGIYVVTHGMVAVQAEASQHSAIVETLIKGQEINVLEVARIEEEQKIRGRLQNPAGWISLLDLANGKSWAQRKR